MGRGLSNGLAKFVDIRPRCGGGTVPGAAGYTDPLPQALVLTAIVISFGMTALIVVLALRGYLETGSDRADLEAPRQGRGGEA